MGFSDICATQAISDKTKGHGKAADMGDLRMVDQAADGLFLIQSVCNSCVQ